MPATVRSPSLLSRAWRAPTYSFILALWEGAMPPTIAASALQPGGNHTAFGAVPVGHEQLTPLQHPHPLERQQILPALQALRRLRPHNDMAPCVGPQLGRSAVLL